MCTRVISDTVGMILLCYQFVYLYKEWQLANCCFYGILVLPVGCMKIRRALILRKHGFGAVLRSKHHHQSFYRFVPVSIRY